MSDLKKMCKDWLGAVGPDLPVACLPAAGTKGDNSKGEKKAAPKPALAAKPAAKEEK